MRRIDFVEKMIKGNSFFQFVKFCIVGASNTIISYAVYSLCVYCGLHYFVANAIGFVVGVTNAFFWSNRYVFKKDDDEKRNLWITFFKTITAYALTGLLLSSGLLYLFIDKLEISKYVAQLLSLTVTVPLNFILNKYWSFRTKNKVI